MCGIAGILHFDGRAINPGLLLCMTRTLVHRGPDEEGYFINDGKQKSWEARRPGSWEAKRPGCWEAWRLGRGKVEGK